VIDLQPFCNTRKNAKWTGTVAPFNQGSHAYATDSHILVRVAQRDLPEPEGKVPNVLAMSWDVDGEWQPLPPVSSLVRANYCNDCGNTGKVSPTVECPMCDCLVPYPGPGKDCRCCVLTLGGLAFGAGYLRKIEALPGPVEWLIAPSGGTEKNNVLHFRFQGGRGMLMPVAVKKPDNVPAEGT